MTQVIFTVGNLTQYRNMPWLDALAFYYHVQGQFSDLFEWKLVDREEEDREDDDILFIKMSYHPVIRINLNTEMENFLKRVDTK